MLTDVDIDAIVDHEMGEMDEKEVATLAVRLSKVVGKTKNGPAFAALAIVVGDKIGNCSMETRDLLRLVFDHMVARIVSTR